MALFKSDEEKRKEFLKKGREYANKNENEKAIKEFEKILKIFPKDEDALFHLGCTYSEIGEYKKSYEAFKKLINLNPHHIEAFNNLGILFVKQGKYSDAIFIYKKGIEYNPDSAMLYNNLGNVYFDIGKYEEALKCFKKAEELDPVYSERLFHLGISSLIKKGNIDDAIKKLEESAKKNMHKAKSFHDLGIAYMERQMYDKAIESFNKAILIDPNYLSAYINLGHAYQHKEDYVSAIKAFEKSVSLNPKSAKLYNTIGLLYDKLGKESVAIKSYKKAVKLDPTYANSHYMLGQLYLNRGNKEKALSEFRKHILIHERGPMVEDAMKRIAEIQNISLEEVKEYFKQFISEEEPTRKAPIKQVEKRDEKDYIKKLKEKMATKKITPSPTISNTIDTPQVKTKTSLQLDPEEYMRKIKQKLKQKKMGKTSDSSFINTNEKLKTPYYNEQRLDKNIQSEQLKIDNLKQESVTPPPSLDTSMTNENIAPNTIEVVKEDEVQNIENIEIINENENVVSLDSEEPTNINTDSNISNDETFTNDNYPPEAYRETIIKPVGENINLPTDNMSEFSKPQKDSSIEKKEHISYPPPPYSSDTKINEISPTSPIAPTSISQAEYKKNPIKNEPPKKKDDDDDDDYKPKTIKRGFF